MSKVIVRTGVAALLGCASLSAVVAPVHAQEYQPYYGNTAFGNAAANTFLNSEINRTMLDAVPNGRSSERNDRRTPPTPPPLYTLPIESQVEVTALEALRPGLQRQWRTHGQQAAQRWYVAAGRKIGGQMGALLAEYRRRAARDGRAPADRWYLEQAREAGARISAAD